MVANFQLVQENYQRVCNQIAETASRSGRSPEDVRLVVVTKTHPVSAIEDVVRAGARRLGENYANEALQKINALGHNPELEWHMIGHVQSRKSAIVAAHFHYLHALDSLKLAARLNRQLQEVGRSLPTLLECNISQEESKYGFAAWDEKTWPMLVEDLQAFENHQFLLVRGLMTIAPYFENPEESRPYFVRLRRLQEYLARYLPFSDWTELSMGMSGDFEVAIEEGATWVRIGTRILGARHYH